MNWTHRIAAASEEIERLRSTTHSMAAQLLAQHALTNALLILVAREFGWRDVLGELAAHASDLIQDAPLEGDAQQMAAVRDRALCLVEDRVRDMMRTFAGSACHPWEGTA